MFNKNLFQGYYEHSVDQFDNLLLIAKGTQNQKKVEIHMPELYLVCGQEVDPDDKEGIKKLIEEGKIIKTSGQELYMELMNLTEDECLMKAKGYDKRTENYIHEISKEIGLIELKAGDEGEAFEVTHKYRIWLNVVGSGYVEVGQLQDGRYVTEYAIQTAIDDYVIINYYFDHLPTQNDIELAAKIEDLEHEFLMRRYQPEFTCWECGGTIHWLDIPGDMKEKVHGLKEKYCGC